MKLIDQVSCVGNKKFAHGPAFIVIEVYRLAPFVLVTVREIMLRKLLQIIPIRPEVIVNHIENDTEAQPMRSIYERAKIIGRAIEPSWREQIDSIIPPTKSARELGDRHHLKHRNSEPGQLG